MNVAVIPARGGSRRIPRKNVREFAGKPIIAYSIECAMQSGLFERVIVSTDDDEVSRIAREYGAEVPFKRPPELSNDHADTTEVIAHAVSWLERSDAKPLAVCCIYATAPFIQGEDLAAALEVYESGQWEYVFSAAAYSYPVSRAFHKDSRGGLQMFFPEQFNTRSQDLPEALHDAGQFYWGRPSAWLNGVRVFDRGSTAVVIPSWRVQDIDTADDWKRAEQMMSLLGRR